MTVRTDTNVVRCVAMKNGYGNGGYCNNYNGGYNNNGYNSYNNNYGSNSYERNNILQQQ